MLTHRPSRGRLIQGFGPRPKPTPTSPAIHYGIDYGWVDSSSGGVGDPVFAAASGVVVDYAPSGAYGNRLRIRLAPGIEIWYCHLHSATVRAGNSIQAGQQVGLTGTTGNVTAKHLHFELRIGGVAVDPAPYFTTPAGGGMTPLPAGTKDDDMKYLHAADRVDALVGEFGYYPAVDTEYAANGRDIFGGGAVTTRNYDVARQDALNRRANLVGEISQVVVDKLSPLLSRPVGVDAAALAEELAPMLVGADATEIARILAPKLDQINQSIAAIPTEFTVSPK